MNRKQRRNLNKKLKNKLGKEEMDKVVEVLRDKETKYKIDSDYYRFKEGDKVRIKTDNILDSKLITNPKLIEFVKNNRDTIFTLEGIFEKGRMSKYKFTFKELDDKNEIKWRFTIEDLEEV